ncbi:MAG: DivIVA domain-containing protein [Mycoplasmoidaceae bacterium]|nr:DivIVA domain-containing protein [Mycoplasmoidaceae bacterium]
MTNKEMTEKILNKKFKKAVFSGYDTTDVDSYFDEVIEYLKNNDKMVELYKDDNDKLKNQLKDLMTVNANLEKEKKKLIREIKEYEEEGYGNMLLKHRNQPKK